MLMWKGTLLHRFVNVSLCAFHMRLLNCERLCIVIWTDWNSKTDKNTQCKRSTQTQCQLFQRNEYKKTHNQHPKRIRVFLCLKNTRETNSPKSETATIRCWVPMSMLSMHQHLEHKIPKFIRFASTIANSNAFHQFHFVCWFENC